MKKLLHLFTTSALLCSSLSLGAAGKISILGVEYQVDTVSHLKVGPGTTTTHLRLSGPNLLQAHYLTIDKSLPEVSIHAVCGTDKVAGCERTSSMAKRKSTPNRLYFAGSNADFFTTSGNATNGSSKVGSPTTSCTVDGEIYKTSNSQYQFTIDRDEVARIGRLNYYTGTATLGDKVTLYKGVNVASPSNGITVYTSRYWGSTNQNDKAGACAEVVARLVEGDEFVCGGKYRMEVMSEPNTDGDTAIPDGQFVIHGRGTSTSGCNTGAIDFVKALKPGDIVTLDNVVLFGNERIYPTQIVSGNPKNVGNGETLDTESERGDASALHPRTGIGVSEDGNTIIMMVVEGRHSGSVGVRTSQLADILRYAGAYEGVNLDGGGSSTLYTSAFGIRNYCSDGSERAVGNGIFATVDLPDEIDNTITEVRFAEWHVKLPQYARYTPHLIGYNRYGLVVNDSITDYTLTCPAELGEVRGNYILASGAGTHALSADVNGVKATVPVTVDNNVEFSTRIPDLLIDGIREYTVELIASDGIKTTNVAPEALTWNSSDVAVATVSDNGVIKGVADGKAVITGKVGDKEAVLNVTVEVAKTPAINILENYDTTKWKFSKSGCGATTAVNVAGTGIEIPYTVTSARSASLTLTPNPQLQFWSIPDALELNITAEGAPVTATTVKLITANGVRLSATLPAVEAGSQETLRVNMSDITNADDLLIYPIRLISLNFGLQPKSGNEGKVVFPEFNAVYGVEGGVGEIFDDVEMLTEGAEEYYNLQGIRVQNPSEGLYIRKWGNKAEKVIIR
ncbi:MAG: phosphodiester glycosidase family protein [Muribaculaceae bacterium]|nr:phosphodiester glycosidase family protein [Muribaculaceae bacterium]